MVAANSEAGISVVLAFSSRENYYLYAGRGSNSLKYIKNVAIALFDAD
jgi:hypothetical protein